MKNRPIMLSDVNLTLALVFIVPIIHAVVVGNYMWALWYLVIFILNAYSWYSLNR